MATRTILFRGQTRRKGERTSISGIPLPGIWVAGGVFPQNKGYDYAIIYQQNPKVEKYVVHADTIGQYTGINDSLGNFIFEDSLDCHRLILVDESHYFETIDIFDDYDIDFDVIGNF